MIFAFFHTNYVCRLTFIVIIDKLTNKAIDQVFFEKLNLENQTTRVYSDKDQWVIKTGVNLYVKGKCSRDLSPFEINEGNAKGSRNGDDD